MLISVKIPQHSPDFFRLTKFRKNSLVSQLVDTLHSALFFQCKQDLPSNCCFTCVYKYALCGFTMHISEKTHMSMPVAYCGPAIGSAGANMFHYFSYTQCRHAHDAVCLSLAGID